MRQGSNGVGRGRGTIAAARALLVALVLAASLPVHGAAQEAPLAGRIGHGPALAVAPPVPATDPAGLSPDPCTDRAYTAGNPTWDRPWAWSFHVASTPDGLDRDLTERVLRRAIRNVTGARNDCGRPDRVGAEARYLGRTTTRPGLTREGTCSQADGRNVVGFGRLPPGYAGLTCIWVLGSRIVEADMKLDRSARWATGLAACASAQLIEAVVTHEAGHVFGLGHVSEDRHGRLTMSIRLDGICQNGESTLGLGDLLGLEALY